MKVTTREVKFRDPNGRMVSSLVIGNGSLHDEVSDYLDNSTVVEDAVAGATESWLTENITQPTTPVVDASLSVSGAAADSKKVGDEISDLKSQIDQLEAIPHAVKLAMDSLFAKVAFYSSDPSSDYATFHAWAMAINVLSISAVFEQGDNIIYTHDSLDTLRQYLTVTANFSDGTSSTVTGYTLSGTLAEGTSTITVAYNGKTTSFNVSVTQGAPSEYTKVSYITANNNSVNTALATQYINSGYVIPSGSSKLKIYEQLRIIPNSNTGLSRNGAYGSLLFGVSNESNSYKYSVNTMTEDCGTPSTTNFDEIVAEMNLTSGAWKFSANGGTEHTGSRSSAPILGQYNIFTLAYKDESANKVCQGFSADLKSFKVYVDDVLVIDFVPCVRESDGIAGMYDVVRRNFYPSTGSSNFAYTE